MNKSELVGLVAETLDATSAAAERAVNAVLGGIQEGLKKDGSVTLVNFGTFEVRQRKARMGRNPRSGASIYIAASKSVGFRAGKALKDTV